MSDDIKYTDEWDLEEIIHQPVTFTKESLQKDNNALNEMIHKGFYINQMVRTETGIVYVLAKWTRKQRVERTEHETKKQQHSWKTFVGENENEQ